METVRLARRLLNIPSYSGDEQDVGQFLFKRLSKNFVVRKQKIGNSFNLLASKADPMCFLLRTWIRFPELLQ